MNYLFHTFVILLIIILIFLIFSLPTALLLSIAFISFSPVTNMYYVETGNIPIGWWGWGNIARYSSVLILPLLFYAYDKSKNRILLISVGFFATFFSWLSQENLLASSLLIVFFFFMKFLFPWSEKRTSIYREIVLVLSGVLPAFLLLCFEWTRNGYIFEAYRNYFLVPRSVSSGYSGSTWIDSPNIWYGLYQLSPIIIICLNLFLVFVLLKSEKSDKNLIKLVLYLNFGYSVSYMGSLFRSDYVHFMNTSINLVPIVFLFFFTLLTFKPISSIPYRYVGDLFNIIFPILSFMFTFMIFKFIGISNQNPFDMMKNKVSNVVQFLDSKKVITPTTYFKGIGYLKSEDINQICCPELGITFSQLHYISQELKKSIGDSKVLISTRIPYIYPEVFYFVGNLNPAETRYERLGLQVNEDIANLDRIFLKNNSSDIKFIVTLTSDDDIEILSQYLNLNYLFFRNVVSTNLSLSVYKVIQ